MTLCFICTDMIRIYHLYRRVRDQGGHERNPKQESRTKQGSALILTTHSTRPRVLAVSYACTRMNLGRSSDVSIGKKDNYGHSFSICIRSLFTRYS